MPAQVLQLNVPEMNEQRTDVLQQTLSDSALQTITLTTLTKFHFVLIPFQNVSRVPIAHQRREYINCELRLPECNLFSVGRSSD